MKTQLITNADMPEEDREQLRASLLDWQREGVINPQIPSEVDADGDGTADAYGLDSLGRLVYILAVPLDDTVYLSEGPS